MHHLDIDDIIPIASSVLMPVLSKQLERTSGRSAALPWAIRSAPSCLAVPSSPPRSPGSDPTATSSAATSRTHGSGYDGTQTIAPSWCQATTTIKTLQSLASLNFYRKPVQLADEGTNEFLGFIVNANTREVRYQMHPERWRYRNITSTGSLRLRLSGFFSRKHLIQKYTFPEAVTKQQLRDLWQLYKDMGFPEDRL